MIKVLEDVDKRVKLGAKKRENDIDEQRLDVSTGLGLTIYMLDFTKRLVILLFFEVAAVLMMALMVLPREVFPAQVLDHRVWEVLTRVLTQ